MMEEYLAYSEISRDNLVPVVATLNKATAAVSYRDVTKDDILYLVDPDSEHHEDEDHPMKQEPVGGWLFRNNGGNKTSWVRRYAMLKCGYIFFFHSPTNIKPVGVIPLIETEIVVPQGGAKTFEPAKLAIRDNTGGYEFDIVSQIRDPIRIQCPTAEERIVWVEHCNERIEVLKSTRNGGVLTLPKSKSKSTISQTGTKITVTTSLILLPYSTKQSVSAMDSDEISIYTPSLHTAEPSIISNARSKFTDNSIDPEKERQAQQDAIRKEKERIQEIERQRIEQDKIAKKEEKEALRLEMVAKERLKHQKILDEAREREKLNPLSLAEMYRYMLWLTNEQVVDDPPAESDPMFQIPLLKGSFANKVVTTVYRHYCSSSGYMTFDDYVEFYEDSGIASTHIPRDEHNDPLQSFVTQLNPLTIINSIPRELGFSKDLLTNLSVVEGDDDMSDISDIDNDPVVAKLTSDNPLNFSQFYFVLYRISQIVYDDLSKVDSTLAFNKLLLETILPMFVWTQDHSRLGCTDPLLVEQRIPLLFVTYAPNLWKVFLLYAQDLRGTSPNLNLPFPETAKCSERVLFSLPFGCAIKKSDLDYAMTFMLSDSGVSTFGADTAFIMTKAACLKFARDYGLVPYLMTRKQFKDIFNQVNRKKNCAVSKPTVAISVPASAPDNFTKSYKPVSPFKPHRDSKIIHSQGMHFGGKDSGKGLFKPPESPSKSEKLILGDFTAHGGISFSEFIELLGRVATEGMKQNEHYNVLFPSTFGKVLALLTVWSVADLSRLEDVRAVNNEG